LALGISMSSATQRVKSKDATSKKVSYCLRGHRHAQDGTQNVSESFTDEVVPASEASERSLLIVENDKGALQNLAGPWKPSALRSRPQSHWPKAATGRTSGSAFAVVEMQLADGRGLDLIAALKRRRPGARAIVLTKSQTVNVPLKRRSPAGLGLPHGK